jgi:nicotinic acid phosphoribosyltransferase
MTKEDCLSSIQQAVATLAKLRIEEEELALLKNLEAEIWSLIDYIEENQKE